MTISKIDLYTPQSKTVGKKTLIFPFLDHFKAWGKMFNLICLVLIKIKCEFCRTSWSYKIVQKILHILIPGGTHLYIYIYINGVLACKPFCSIYIDKIIKIIAKKKKTTVQRNIILGFSFCYSSCASKLAGYDFCKNHPTITFDIEPSSIQKSLVLGQTRLYLGSWPGPGRIYQLSDPSIQMAAGSRSLISQANVVREAPGSTRKASNRLRHMELMDTARHYQQIWRFLLDKCVPPPLARSVGEYSFMDTDCSNVLGLFCESKPLSLAISQSGWHNSIDIAPQVPALRPNKVNSSAEPVGGLQYQA